MLAAAVLAAAATLGDTSFLHVPRLAMLSVAAAALDQLSLLLPMRGGAVLAAVAEEEPTLRLHARYPPMLCVVRVVVVLLEATYRPYALRRVTRSVVDAALDRRIQ